MDFAIPADYRVKLKESKKKDKYLDLARELKKTNKLRNIKVAVIPVINPALGKVTKGFVQGQEDLEIRRRVETVQTTTFLRPARILRRVLETWGDLLSLSITDADYADDIAPLANTPTQADSLLRYRLPSERKQNGVHVF